MSAMIKTRFTNMALGFWNLLLPFDSLDPAAHNSLNPKSETRNKFEIKKSNYKSTKLKNQRSDLEFWYGTRSV